MTTSDPDPGASAPSPATDPSAGVDPSTLGHASVETPEESSQEAPATQGQGSAVTMSKLALVGALVVLLSFAASFLGARMATSGDKAEAVALPSASPSHSPTDASSPSASPEQSPVTLPAGADVRAGSGTPANTYGEQGDIFLNVDNGDVYLREANAWRRAGNLGAFAAENLTGQQGEQGQQGGQGAAGEPGASGEPGRPGTQVLLGKDTPDPKDCTEDGDIFVNVKEQTFYTCKAGKWEPVTP